MVDQVLFSTREVAHMLNVTQVQVIKQINAGRLKAKKIGNQYVVTEEDYKEYKATKRPVGRPKLAKQA